MRFPHLLCLLSAAAPLTAQLGVAPGNSGAPERGSSGPIDFALPYASSAELNSLEWPADPAYGEGPFGRAVVGDLTGDGAAEVVVLRGGAATVLYQPALYSAFWSIPGPFLDLAHLPSVPGSGGGTVPVPGISDVGATASLLTVGPGGLERWSYAPANSPGEPFEALSLAGGPWAGALRLCTNELPSAPGARRVAAVAATGRDVLLGTLTPSGSFLPTPGLALGSTVHDLAFVHWDLDAEPEVAVLSTAGLTVYKTSGLPVFSQGAAVLGGAVAAFQQVDRPFERVAWIAQGALSGQQQLRVADASGSELPLALDGLDGVALCAGDMDDDGFDELTLGHRSAPTLIQLWNQAGGSLQPTFRLDLGDPTATRVLALEQPPMVEPTWTGMRPALGDFDGDERLDVIAPLVLTERVHFFRSADLLMPPTGEEPVFTGVTYLQNGPTGELVVSANLEPVDGATHVDVVLWRQERPGRDLDDEAVFHCRMPFEGTETSVFVPIPESTVPFTALYYLDIRTVVLDGDGEVTRSGPFAAGGLTLNLLQVGYLESLPGAGPAQPLFSTVIVGGTVIGGFVPNAGRIAFFEEQVVPQTATATACP